MLAAFMASFGHIAVGLAAGRAFTPKGTRWRNAALVFSAVSFWPDLDAVGFLFGEPYSAPWGHRGATHSLTLALLVALGSLAVARWRQLPLAKTFLFTLAVAASHGLLDCLTFGGGLGCALFWPISVARFWSPVRFIPIAPIGPYMLSMRGLRVVLAEVVLFAPFWLYAFWPRPRAAAG
jgi:inner membrane protein